MRGKIAVVTGGANGIGFACAKRLTEAGAIVVVADRDEEAGRAAAAELSAHFISIDVSSETSIEDAAKAIEADIGQELITLAVRIAEQVLHRTLKTEPEALLALVDDILKLDTGKSAVLQLYVNPDDQALVRDYLRDNPDASMWRVLPDETITRGGCKARTALGDIDATLEKRWERVVSSIGGTV